MKVAGTKTLLAAMGRHPARVTCRAAALAAMVAFAACELLFRRSASTSARASWAARWLRRCLRICGVRLTVTGAHPIGDILVANHTSYLDIAVIAAVQPTIFVARHDLKTLPVFGRLARRAGTIFINRRRKRDLLAVIAALPAAVNSGAVPTFFPEGATTNGDTLLPFRSSLFAPAVAQQWRVVPVHIRYALDAGDGAVERDVCWWGGAKFLPHFIALLAKRRLHVRVTIGHPVSPGHDRKALARELQRRVEKLGEAEPAKPVGSQTSLRELARVPLAGRGGGGRRPRTSVPL